MLEKVFITSYSDIVYSVDTITKLINFSDIVITYDPNWLWQMRFNNPLSDAENFRLDGDRLIEIGLKASSIEEIEGQYMGLLKFTPAGWLKEGIFGRTFSKRNRY